MSDPILPPVEITPPTDTTTTKETKVVQTYSENDLKHTCQGWKTSEFAMSVLLLLFFFACTWGEVSIEPEMMMQIMTVWGFFVGYRSGTKKTP